MQFYNKNNNNIIKKMYMKKIKKKFAMKLNFF